MPATTLTEIADGLWGLEDELSLPGGAKLPVRATVAALGDGGLAIYSPVAMAEQAAAAVAKLGRLQYVIAPSGLHHLYVAPTLAKFPEAKLYASPVVAKKRKGLRFDGVLTDGLPPGLAAVFSALTIEGAPAVQETVMVHNPTGSLLVTDLLFNITHPRGWMSKFVLGCTGTNGRLAQSRLWQFYGKDKAALKTSTQKMLDLSWDRLIPCHGEVLATGAKNAVTAALRWK
ncbi:MAG: DUF4336 domain-containing protein [Deltaproteobacteria bacterium]|nr:DUF4336 domain-containing protein [Deltaproteobacteria bacterium]